MQLIDTLEREAKIVSWFCDRERAIQLSYILDRAGDPRVTWTFINRGRPDKDIVDRALLMYNQRCAKRRDTLPYPPLSGLDVREEVVVDIRKKGNAEETTKYKDSWL